MLKAITVTEINRQGCNDRYKITGPVGLGGRIYSTDCQGSGDAAAKAVEYAMNNLGGANYVILGSEKVLKHIPAELRSKGV